MDVLLSNITGVACNDPVICIKQRGDNKTLYFQNNPEQIEMKFNLPPGKWTTKNKLRKLKNPLVYICPPMAEPELNREIKPFKFRVQDNPNKVTISFAYKNFADIKCDPEIWKQSIPAFVFVMMHEHGHYYYGGKDKDNDPEGYYRSETNCDIFACNKMLQNGFNPSQCLWGINLCLSDAEPAQQRKRNVLYWVNEVKVQGEENFMTKPEEYIGKQAIAKADGTAMDEVSGEPINVKAGDDLGTIDSVFGPDNSGRYSTSKNIVVSANLILNEKDLKASEAEKKGQKRKKGFGVGDKDIDGLDLSEHAGDLLLLLFGLALIFGGRRNN